MADLIARSGFAPIHLSEINFQVLYEQRLEKLNQDSTNSTPTA